MKKIVLETERLILRNYEESDFNDYWEYVSQKKVGPMCGWPAYTDKKKAKERLEVEIAKPYQFAIVLKEENKVIGSVELMDFKQERFCNLDIKQGTKEIGYLLSENYWGKGIMPEAVKKVMQFAFENLNVPNIVICHVDANTQSGRVQDKLGFKIIGHLQNHGIWIDGTNIGLIQRMMTREEYLNMYKKVNRNEKQTY